MIKASCSGEDANSGACPPACAEWIGVDIGSTTIKAVGLSQSGETVFRHYDRHFSHIRESLIQLLQKLAPFCAQNIRLCLTGSGGLELAQELKAPFIQEVLASRLAIDYVIPDADVVLELGGEDAKLTYLAGGVEQRMNETCAGGTGAFIDQMAAFIGVDAAGLDSLAGRARTIYPIASRCGVFAKSDILPLLNEGCSREDIAASIMQAVVNQTISGLAQGRPISGKVVFIGGPIHFLASLRARFAASLKEASEAVFPDFGHFFVALGAAMHCANCQALLNPEAAAKALAQGERGAGMPALSPLFASAKELEDFRRRHPPQLPPVDQLANAAGKAWLGIDSGSTTIKVCLIDDSGNLIYSLYLANRGNALQVAINALKEIHSKKRDELVISGACVTGYGSAMLAAALNLDFDEVETVAHLEAASFYEPDVSFILDIGGQDIKCLYVKRGIIERISLNEACSAGCGSFIDNFAASLGLGLPEFIEQAICGQEPVDLGSRCTVFMNSRVRQAQKEGAKIADIAAGLCWAVIKNAVFKVLKIKNIADLGEKIIAQGGAFQNDALLRALELQLGRRVTRPQLSGLMGAFGAALLAKKRRPRKSSLLTLPELLNFKIKTTAGRCGRCANNCMLTISHFNDNQRFIAGNRCERGSGVTGKSLPNLHAWKYRRLFSYEPLPEKQAKRGRIGIPRVLNIYENFPLWFTILTKLGFRVELSAPAPGKAHQDAFDTVPSQTVCLPAKLAHGHIQNLCDRGLQTIFYPCVKYEQKNANFNHGLFNCPVVAGYPEIIPLNMPCLCRRGVNLIHDFLPLDPDNLPRRLQNVPFFAAIPPEEIDAAVSAGFDEMAQYRADLQKAGEEALARLGDQPALIVAGHPYHIDPEINHGIPELINACGLGVLTEDSIAHFMPDPGELRVVDQWAYHSRLYRAGAFASKRPNLAVLQLVSFGCGLDAVTSDQLEEIAERNGNLYAMIKIDEGFNTGPAKIRIRSLLAAMRERLREQAPAFHTGAARASYPVFTPEMRHTHTLLIPQMSPLHFQFATEIFGCEGYDAALLPSVSSRAIEAGLRHVNNDACYPAIMVIGQLIDAIQSGGYEASRVALVISQTGGGCRATNYMALLRKALISAGLGDIPIANFSATQRGPGIKLTTRLLSRLIMAGHYGDALMRTLHRLRPYEKTKGSTEELIRIWSQKGAKNIESCNLITFQRNMFALVRDFDNLPLLTEERRERFGLVGEILLKYHPDANNNAARIIEREGGEAVVTDIMDFMLYCLYEQVFNYEQLSGSKKSWLLARGAMAWQELTRLSLRMALNRSKRFGKAMRFCDLRAKAKKLISLGHSTGEGWLLVAEMIKMLENGVSSILCMQPFGCLPNHIVGKGVIRELKRRYPGASIVALDYDASASQTNQINRIKLMMRSGLRPEFGSFQS